MCNVRKLECWELMKRSQLFGIASAPGYGMLIWIVKAISPRGKGQDFLSTPNQAALIEYQPSNRRYGKLVVIPSAP